MGLAEKQRQKTDSDYGKKDDLFLRFLDEDEVARPLQNARSSASTTQGNGSCNATRSDTWNLGTRLELKNPFCAVIEGLFKDNVFS